MFDDAIAAAALATPQVVRTVAMVPGLQVHVDGDYLAYYASGNDETSPGEARQNALDLIESFRARIGAEHIIVHNTARGCHKGERYLVATVKPYQGNRKSDRKPKNHAYLQEWIMGYEGPAFRTKNWATREADDGIGACAHYAVGQPPGYIGIAAADKDMRMLPGVHISWRTRDSTGTALICTRVEPGAFEVIGEDGKLYGLKWFWQQMLEGDTADHCPGLEHGWLANAKGVDTLQSIGPAKATRILAETATTDDAFHAVLGAYLRGYGHSRDTAHDRFVEQAALLWMRLGNDAAVCDFAHHRGHSRINQPFTQEVWDAVARLEQRVEIARNEINTLSN